MVRVLLVDDHNIVRAGLKALLESTGRIDVVGEASSGKEAVDEARRLEPEIIIMDLSMPGMDGVQATRSITELGLETRILVLTNHDEDEFLIPALNAGAAGFLNKSVADTDLMGAIEAVMRGRSFLTRRAAGLLVRRRAKGNSGREPGPEVLSPSERRAVEMYANGYSARESAAEMLVSPKTVEGYIARAKTKLGLHTRRDIVRFALQAGLLQAEREQ